MSLHIPCELPMYNPILSISRKRSNVSRHIFTVVCLCLWQSCLFFPLLFSFRACFHSCLMKEILFYCSFWSRPSLPFQNERNIKGNCPRPPHGVVDWCFQGRTILRSLGQILNSRFMSMISICMGVYHTEILFFTVRD